MAILQLVTQNSRPAALYHRLRSRPLYANLVVAGLYLLLTVVVTWPILPNFGSQVVDTNDPFFIAWVVGSEIWSLRNGDFANFWNQNIFYPYPNTLAFSDHSLTLTAQAAPVYLLTNNPVAAVNFLTLLGFFLSALCAYSLVRYYTASRTAAFFGGLVYGFSSFHVAQLNHLQINNYQYIPLALLCFEKLLKTPTWKNALFFALAFTLNAFVSVYLLTFSIVPLAVIFVYRLVAREVRLNWRFIRNFGLAVGLAVVLVTPGLWLYPQISRDFNYHRTVPEFFAYSARFGDFLLSAPTNWLMGWHTPEVVRTDTRFAWEERSVYLGFITIVVALFGVATFDPAKRKLRVNRVGVAWLVILVGAVILALGPIFAYTTGRNFNITYGPGYLVQWLFPPIRSIRVPARFVVIAVLALAVLTGFAVQKAVALKTPAKQIVLAAIALVFLFEQGSFPLRLKTPDPLNTALYEWTAANVEGDVAVVHYPFSDPNSHAIEYERGSLIDHKRTLNGYSSFIPESTKRLFDLSRTDPDGFLKVAATRGVKYLVIHTNYLVPGDTFPAYIQSHATLLTTIANDPVYDISGSRNTEYFNTPTSEAGYKVEGGKLLVQKVNNSASIWVTPRPEKFDIQVSFMQGNKKVGETRVSLYKPLYLMPGETFSETVELTEPLFTGYDNLIAEVK